MLIGLTGRNAAGKGEVAKYLQTKSFYYYSLSDAIREEIRARKLEVSREALIQVGNELRQRFGPSVLADRIVELTQPDRNYVIDSIRNPAEVAALRKACKDFKLIRVDAPLQARFERTVARRRENDPVTFEAFVALDNREAAGDATSQNLAEVEAPGGRNPCQRRVPRRTAAEDRRAGRAASEERAAPGLGSILHGYRPRRGFAIQLHEKEGRRRHRARQAHHLDRDTTAHRAGRRTATKAAVRDATTWRLSGTSLDECLCSHGEENAIVQASYHGVSLKDATIYSTFAPCLMCAKMIINSGIVEVVYNLDYPLNESAFRLFKEAGVTIRRP